MNYENSNHQTPIICTKCGTELSPEFKFCTKCGTATPNNIHQATIEPQIYAPLPPIPNRPIPPKKPLNKKLLIPIISVCSAIILIIFLFGTHIICINHDWSASTCVEPAQCRYCNKYKDEKLGNHDWMDATCSRPRKCFYCDAEEGEPISHTWTDATCTKSKTCSTCGTVEGQALGHSADESIEWDFDYDELIKTRELICKKCEAVIETQEKSVTSFIENKCFTIHPAGFADRFEESSSRLNGINYSTKSEYTYDMPTYVEGNYLYYRIQDENNDYSDVGIISFTKPDGETISAMEDFSENSFNSMNILIEDTSDVSAVVYATLLAIDPSIGYDEAAKVGQAIVDGVQDLRLVDDDAVDSIDKNSISYALCKDRNYHYLIVSVTSNQ